MGEAKRRQKLDPNYGKVRTLSTTALKEQEAEKISLELFDQFSPDLRLFMIAESVPDNYYQLSDRIQDWLHHRLDQYSLRERQFIARFIFFFIADFTRKYGLEEKGILDNISPILFCCFLRATKNHLSTETLDDLTDKFNQCFDHRRKYDQLTKFAYQEILEQLN